MMLPRLPVPLALLAALLLSGRPVHADGGDDDDDKSYGFQGDDICTKLTETKSLASSAFDCVMSHYSAIATQEPGCSDAFFAPDTVATEDVYRCACSLVPAQLACLSPACEGDQFPRLKSLVSSAWCTGGAVPTTDGNAPSTSAAAGESSPTTPAATGTGSGGATTPRPTTSRPTGTGTVTGGSAPSQTTSTSTALAGGLVTPAVGGLLVAFLGLVAAAL